MKKITLLTFLCMLLTIPIMVGQSSFSTSRINGASIQNPAAGTATRNYQNNVTTSNLAPVVITHSVSQTIIAGNTVACGTSGVPAENSFFRVFDLSADFGITNDFAVSNVEFGIEPGSGPTALTLNIYSTTGTFPTGFPGSLTLKGSSSYTTTAANAGTVVSVPLSATIPAGSKMVYELKINAGATSVFFPGSNNLGQTNPSYIMSAACSISTPSTMASIGFPDVHMVMNVVGEAITGGGPVTYCGPLNFSFVEPITYVDFANISNRTSATSTVAHEDYTAIVGNVTPGSTHTITLEGYTGGNYTNRFFVFFDWNQNGVLNDPGEVYIMTTNLLNSTGADGKQVIQDIVVPAGAMLGNTRMRVKKTYGTSVYDNPCATQTSFGQAEDYTINVQGAGGGVGQPPVIVCPSDITSNNNPGVCAATVNFSPAVAIDPEDGVITTTQTAGPTSGSAFPVGVTMVEFSATDSDGNTVSCQFAVTVVDNEAPVAICQDITISLDPITGLASITAADINNGSTDNCGIDSMSVDISSFDCSMLGTNTVTMTVTDAVGNSSTCTSTVTVVDVTGPEVVCVGGFATFSHSEDFEAASVPAGWSTNILAGNTNWTFGSGDMPTGPDFPTNAAIFNDDAAGSGEANSAELLSPVYNLTGATSAEISFDYANQDYVGAGLLRVEVYDGAAWQEVFLTDNVDVPPTNSGPIDVFMYANSAFQVKFTYDDENEWGWGAGVDNFLLEYQAASGGGLDVYLDANGHASISPNDLVVSVTEACNYTITASGVGGGTVGALGTIFTSGNNGSPGGAVYFDITVGPADIDIDAIDINTADTGAFTMDVYTKTGTYVGSETNQSAWTLSSTATGTSAGQNNPSNAVLATPITLSANTTYGMALVLDANHSHYYTNGTGSNQNFSNDDLALALGAASNTPFSGAVFSPRIFNGTIHYMAGPGSGLEFTCADLGQNLVEVTVTDDSGNTTTCMAVVNVIDNIAPVIICAGNPGPVSIIEDFNGATIPTGWVSIIETGDQDWGFGSGVMPTGGSFASNAAIFNDDAAGSGTANKATLYSPVYDISASSTAGISFDYALQEYLGDGILTVEVFDGANWNEVFVVENNANPVNTGVIDVTPHLNNAFQVRFIYDDEGGWSWGAGIDNFKLDYEVTTVSTVDIPLGPNGTANIDPYSLIQSIDEACGINTVAVDVPQVSCADIGTTITVTVFVSDSSGNISSCSSLVNVVDTMAPEITCPANQTVDPGAGNLFYIVPDYFAIGEASAIDNCTSPVVITSQSPEAGSTLSDGIHTITLTAEDAYGNIGTCTFELTVESVIVGITDNNLETGISLYPNPASDVVNLVNKTNISLNKMVIFDINGKTVQQIDLRTMQGERVIDVSNLSSGVYMVQISGENATTIKRLIKE